MPGEDEPQLRAWVDYFRDLGVHDFYRRGEFVAAAVAEESVAEIHAESGGAIAVAEAVAVSVEVAAPVRNSPVATLAEPEPMKFVSFNNLAPLPAGPVPAAERAGALLAIQKEIGDCTRCPRG